MSNHSRKLIRLSRPTYVGPRWYFVTLCTHDRRPLFSKDELVSLLIETLRDKCSSHSFDVYAFCFMPDHLHLELEGLSERSDLVAMIREFKGMSATKARETGIGPLWQKGYYDHILRSGEAHNPVARYIFNNPVRRGLVKDLRDWPYSGSFMFDWKTWLAPLEEFHPPWKKV